MNDKMSVSTYAEDKGMLFLEKILDVMGFIRVNRFAHHIGCHAYLDWDVVAIDVLTRCIVKERGMAQAIRSKC